MRLTLANKICVCVGGVVLLAVLSSLVALLSSWHVEALMRQTAGDHLPSVRAAEELEIAVLEQRGFVSQYLLDGGNRKWLLELRQRERNFHEWLARAHQTAHTSEEKEILDKLKDVYRKYDAKRTEVVVLYDRGERAAAGRLLVDDVSHLYQRAYELCESFIKANEQYVDTVVAYSRGQIRWVTLTVVGCVLLTAGLGATLLWLFFYGVVLPVRAMVADARDFAGGIASEGQPLPTDELRIVGTYLRNLMSDVTDTRTTLERSRSQLRDAEKLASVGKLAASVAHEIRNPLTAIKMWLFSIQQEVGGAEALDRKFATVSEEIHHLESIVRSFLEFSRPPELKLSIVSMGSILDRSLELLESRIDDRKIELVREDAADLPPILADREQLKQVFVNLLNNAVEVVDTAGRIRVTTTVEPDAEGRRMVVVRVSDNGPGISRDVSQRIFEPFFTTKDEGTGLGLCIAARIMARHRGRLVLASSGERGTTFAVYVPATPAEET